MNEDYRFFDWNYDADMLIEYARDGECNNCGACCVTVIRFNAYNVGLGKPNPILGWKPANGDFIKAGSGQYLEVRVNGRSRYFYDLEITDELYRCPALTVDNKCTHHIGKHLLSRAWPLIPEHVAAFSECSYSFREIGRWKISEMEVCDASR